MFKQYALLVPALLLVLWAPVALLAQSVTPVPPTGFAAFLSSYGVAIAGAGASLAVLGLSHVWPWFHGISVNADGTPSTAGNIVKIGTVALFAWAIMLVLHLFGADAPAGLVDLVGQFWATVGAALGATGVATVAYKAASMAPAK